MYITDVLWDIIKEYQLDWKKTHSGKFIKVMHELEYIFDLHCLPPKAPYLTLHKITGYFHNSYLKSDPISHKLPDLPQIFYYFFKDIFIN
jgi:dolichyl-phosphate-mannose--protein O-mannosyl transferase